MDFLDAVKLLTQKNGTSGSTSTSTNAHMITATATSDSADGKVYVDFGGLTITGDDSQSVELPTTVDVRSGDIVQVTLVGADGTGKTPTVTGVVGGGDRTRSEMVVSVDVEYAISSSGTEAPSDGWQTTAPEQTDDEPYLWTRTASTMGDGSTVYTSATLVPNGVDGVGITSVTEQYYLSTSRTTLTGGSWSDTATAPSHGQYVWTRSVVTYSDGTSTTLDAKSVSGEKGETGATGPQGEAGADGQMLVASSSTAAATAAKVATLASGTLTLEAGVSVTVVFTNANTAASPTLNVAGTGAKAIHTNGTAYAYWAAGMAVTFVYDGSYWQVCSVPVYGSTATIGNPSAKNIYIDADSMEMRDGSTPNASFGANEISLGMNSTSAIIKFITGLLLMQYNATGQTPYSEIRSSEAFRTSVLSGKNNYMGVHDSSGNDSDIGLGLVYESGAYKIYGAASKIELLANSMTMNSYPVLYAKTLFTGDYSTTHSGPITINEDVSAYELLMIEYATDDNAHASVMVANPTDGEIITCTTNYFNGVHMYVKSKSYELTISGSTSTLNTHKTVNGYYTGIWGGDGLYQGGDYIGIVKVIGFK